MKTLAQGHQTSGYQVNLCASLQKPLNTILSYIDWTIPLKFQELIRTKKGPTYIFDFLFEPQVQAIFVDSPLDSFPHVSALTLHWPWAAIAMWLVDRPCMMQGKPRRWMSEWGKPILTTTQKHRPLRIWTASESYHPFEAAINRCFRMPSRPTQSTHGIML